MRKRFFPLLSRIALVNRTYIASKAVLLSLFIQAAPKTKTAPATTFPAPISIPIRPRKLAASSNSLNQNESKSKIILVI